MTLHAWQRSHTYHAASSKVCAAKVQRSRGRRAPEIKAAGWRYRESLSTRESPRTQRSTMALFLRSRCLCGSNSAPPRIAIREPGDENRRKTLRPLSLCPCGKNECEKCRLERVSVVECVWQALARHRCRLLDGVLGPISSCCARQRCRRGRLAPHPSATRTPRRCRDISSSTSCRRYSPACRWSRGVRAC